MWWFVLFGVIVLSLSALAFSLYHRAVCRYDQRVIEEYAETRRRQQRPQKPDATEPNFAFAAVPDEEFNAECADVLAELEQQRKALRRSQRCAQR